VSCASDARGASEGKGGQARNGSVIVSSLIKGESLSGKWVGGGEVLTRRQTRKCSVLCGPQFESLVCLYLI
jgi:hypothetical protein